jgi:hypothetical protein
VGSKPRISKAVNALMATPLIPQEIYLLERFCSLEYYAEMLNAWTKMVEAAEKALQQFTLNLPPDLRSRPLYEQYDITWGDTVLPNFRSTLASLEAGYIMLKSGDLSALGFGGNVGVAVIGQHRDFWPDWMPEEVRKDFNHWQNEADTRAFNLSRTERAGWTMNSLRGGYSEDSRGPFNPPSSWPQYRLNPKVTVKTGDTVTQSGIYLPACDDSCAAVQIKGYECYEAEVGYNPQTTHAISRAATTWTLVERIADSGGGIPGAEGDAAGIRIRVEAGKHCPQAGFYFTPAKTNSRQSFKLGDIMPSVGGDYGSTIWQMDTNQEPSKL